MRCAIVSLTLLLGILVAGCGSPAAPANPAAPAPARFGNADLDAELERARSAKHPVILVITAPGRSPEDDSLRALMLAENGSPAADCIVVDLDVNASRSRSIALRYQAADDPTILFLSSRGLIVSRVEKGVSKEALHAGIDDLLKRGPELDAKLAGLESKASEAPADISARLTVVDFLIGQRNWREAIPLLEPIASSETAAAADRIRAWVDLAQAYISSGSGEKGLHSARDLLATLGPRSPEAQAGAYLVMGLRDAAAKRKEQALREFDQAIAAAPDSTYGKRALDGKTGLSGAAADVH